VRFTPDVSDRRNLDAPPELHEPTSAAELKLAAEDLIEGLAFAAGSQNEVTGEVHAKSGLRDGRAVVSSVQESDDAALFAQVEALIGDAIRYRASDIHLEPLGRKLRLRYRVDGRLVEVPGPAQGIHLPLVSRLKIMANISIAEKRLPQDGRMAWPGGSKPIDLRVSTLPTVHGESVVMRILDSESARPRLEELGLAADDLATLRGLIGRHDGIVLVTGPTGSGKTTTLYSCLQTLNQRERKIITVEDPVEYQLAGVNQVPVRPEVGLTFAAALRALLRQSPNVIMVGEIRDAETAEMAVHAALTGHLVFSTLHTNDAVGAVTRLVDLGIKPYLVAASLRGSVAQRLVRRICPACREVAPPSAAEREALGRFLGTAEGRFARGRGCPACHGSGYFGRLGVFETFLVDPEMERTLSAPRALDALRAAARRAGRGTLQEDALDKAKCGLTTLSEVASLATSEGDGGLICRPEPPPFLPS
jgi:type IV pilus assembly protein PilB